MQIAKKFYLHAGYRKKYAVLRFRVSSLVELWLALIGSASLSIRYATNHMSPRAGQRDHFPRGKFTKARFDN